jgi:hypothetical protein
MAEYTVVASDGKTYRVQGPEGLPEEIVRMDVDRRLRKQLRDAAPPPEPAPIERTMAGRAGEVFRGIPRGAVGLLETAATGASALLPEELEASARERIASIGEAAAAPFQPKPGYEDSISAQFGEAAGSFLPFLAAGPFGLAGRVAATGLGAGAGAGTARERAEQGDATPEERAMATGLGSLVGLSEVVVPFRILGNAIGNVPAQGVLNRLKRAAQAGGEEGLQEAAAEVAQNLIERGVYNPEQGAFVGTGESFGYGAGVGGLAQGLFDLFAPGRGRGVSEPQPAEDTVEQVGTEPVAPAEPLRTVSVPLQMSGGGENGVMRVVQEPSGRLFGELVDPAGNVRMRQPIQAASPNAFLDEIAKLERAGQPVTSETFVAAVNQASTITRPPEQQELFDTTEAPVSGAVPPPSLTAEEVEAAAPPSVAPTRQELEAAGQTDLVNELGRLQAEDLALAAEQQQRGDLFPDDLEAATSDDRMVAGAMGRQQVQEDGAQALEQDAAEAVELQGQEQLDLLGPFDPFEQGATVSQQTSPGVAAFSPLTTADLDAAKVPKNAPVRKRVVGNTDAAAVKADLQALATNENIAPAVAASVKGLADSIVVTPPTTQVAAPKVKIDDFISEFSGSGAGTYVSKLSGRIADAKRKLAQGEEVPQGIRASLGVEIEPLQAEVDRLEALRPLAQRADDANQKRNINKAMLSGVRQELDVSNLSQSEKQDVVEEARKAASPEEASQTILGAIDTAAATPAVTAPEQEFRAKVARVISNADQAKLADAYQTVVGEAPPADVKTAVKKFSLPEQVAVANEFNSIMNRPLFELPGRFSVQPKREEAASIPANVRLMDRVRRGDSAANILGGISQDTDVPQPLRNLARSMLRVAPNITVPVIERRYKEPDVVGQYVHPQQGDEAIYLDPRAESAAQTFLHEFVHPMTVNAIARGTPEGKRVVQLFEQYKEQHPESTAYGFENAYEFVAEGITNQNFQKTLKRQNWWGRFTDAIRRIIGLPASQSGTVEELIDLTKRMGAAENISRTQAAADKVVFDDTPANNTAFLRVQGEELKSTSKPMRSKPVRDAVAKVMGTTPGSATADAARAVLTWGLPLPALNDYVQSYIAKKGPAYEPFAAAMQRFTNTAVRYEGAMREFTDSITAQIARMGEWKTNNADKYEAFTNLYFGASHAKVDLTKPESEYAGNPEKLSAYKRLKKDFIAIGGSGQAIYRQMRAIHNRQFKQISQQVFDRIYAETKNSAMATRARDAFARQMREKGPLEGYAPMLRPSGKHMLKYVIKGEDAFEIFTNPNDRAAREQQLLDEGVKREDIKPFLGDNLSNFDGIVPSSFLGQLVTTLKDGGASPELIESIMNLGVSMSPPNSVLERLASRKEVAGYVRDPFWAFQEGTMGLGRKLINMQYGARMNNELRNMQDTRKNIGDDPIAASILNDVAKRANYAANPSQAWWSNVFTTGTYAWTLGFNVSSAIVDMSSLVLVTGPYLTRTYGWAKTHRAMMQSAKEIMGMGTSADVETLVTQGLEGAELQEALKTLGTKERDMVRRKTSPSMLNIDFNDPVQAKRYGYLKPLVDKVRESGHSERYSELSESAEFGESNRLSKWSARMGFMMNASERFKREIGIKAAYDLELSKFGTAPTPEQMAAAAQKAMEMSLLLNGGSTAVTGARFQQNDIFRIAFMYRRFAALQMYLQAKTAYDSTLNDDPAVKAAARQFAAYTMLTSAAFVGVKGMPMMGTVAALWAMFGAVFGEEDEDNSLDNFLRTNLDPILVEGIPNILFNANVAGRMEMTNLLIRDSNLPNDATLADGIAAHFGGPTYGSISRAIKGAGMIAEGEIQRGVENMLPVSISNIFKSGRFLAEGAIETLRDDVVVEVNPLGAMAQALGFAPADYARAMDFNIGQSNAERRISDRRTGLYEAVYTAYRVGDTDGVAQAMRAIIEFNQRYPEFVITSQGLRQSISGRDRNTQDMVMGRLPSARTRGVTLETAEDWGF